MAADAEIADTPSMDATRVVAIAADRRTRPRPAGRDVTDGLNMWEFLLRRGPKPRRSAFWMLPLYHPEWAAAI